MSRRPAVHGVLAGLSPWADSKRLFARYERDPVTDFTLIVSLVGLTNDLTNELLWRVCDAAYFLHWQKVRGGCS